MADKSSLGVELSMGSKSLLTNELQSLGCVSTQGTKKTKLLHFRFSQAVSMSAAMAKAQEELGGGASLKDGLSCPGCLCLYRSPVSLSCGHNLCEQCFQKALGAQQQSKAPYSCGMCKLHLGPILELQKNFHLCSIVEAFQANTCEEQEDKGSAEEKEAVLCDYCLGLPLPAVKTCLICDASLCQSHLDKHNAKASHVLVEVGTAMSEERRCREHGRLLESFCQDEEQQNVCVLCSIAGCHKCHTIITMKEAHDKQLGELSDTVRWLHELESALATALEELQESENQLKINTKTVTSQLQKLFKEMKMEIIQKEKIILRDIQSNKKKQLADITKVKKEMEQRRDEVVQRLQSWQEFKQLDTDRLGNCSVSRMDLEDWHTHMMAYLSSLLQRVFRSLRN